MQHLDEIIDKLHDYHIQVESNINSSCIKRQDLGSLGEVTSSACRVMEVLINEMMKESFRVQTIINMLHNNPTQGMDYANQLMDELVMEDDTLVPKEVDYSKYH